MSNWFPVIGGPLDRSAIEIDDLPSKTHFVVQVPEPPEEDDIESMGMTNWLRSDLMKASPRYASVRYNLYELKSRTGRPHQVFAAEGTEWMLIDDRLVELEK